MEHPEKIQITFTLGNDAFYTPEHVATAMRKLAERLEDVGWEDEPIRYRDVNGNTVGVVLLDP